MDKQVLMRTVMLTRDELYELAAQVLEQGSPFVFAARGNSMLPFIREGDLLTVVPLGGALLRPGEIALYRRDGGSLLAHRVIGPAARGGEAWLMRSDGSRGELERVRSEEVLGRIVSLERRGRTRRLDTRRRLWVARLWHRLWPWSLWAYTLVSRLKSRLLRAGRGLAASSQDPVLPEGIRAIYNVRPLGDDLLTGGQPTPEQLAAAARAGYEVVINLATPDSPRALAGEEALVESLGMRYEALPVVWGAPQQADFQRFCALLERHVGQRILVHCAANMRVSAFCYLYRVLRQGMAPERAVQDLFAVWEPNETWRAFIECTLAEDTAAEDTAAEDTAAKDSAAG
jgi:protein tyrosine phosphatase (PTP) superfamily phosphohydrolase (DUF442 family)